MVAGYCGVCCDVCACLCGSCLREFVVLGGLRLMVWCFGSAESGFDGRWCWWFVFRWVVVRWFVRLRCGCCWVD